MVGWNFSYLLTKHSKTFKEKHLFTILLKEQKVQLPVGILIRLHLFLQPCIARSFVFNDLLKNSCHIFKEKILMAFLKIALYFLEILVPQIRNAKETEK